MAPTRTDTHSVAYPRICLVQARFVYACRNPRQNVAAMYVSFPPLEWDAPDKVFRACFPTFWNPRGEKINLSKGVRSNGE